jgi:hypothetical protein
MCAIEVLKKRRINRNLSEGYRAAKKQAGPWACFECQIHQGSFSIDGDLV